MPEVIKTGWQMHGGDAVRIPDAEAARPPMCMESDEGYAAEAAPEPKTIIREIYRDPEPLTRADIERLYADELNGLRAQAWQSAYEDAAVRYGGEMADCIRRVDECLHAMQVEHDRYIEQYDEDLRFFAVDIAEKMILQKISEDDIILRSLVLETVSRMKNPSWMKLELSGQMTDLIEFMKEELAKPEYFGRATVNPIAAPGDTCRVSTEEGTTVATVSVQASNLRKVFSEADWAD